MIPVTNDPASWSRITPGEIATDANGVRYRKLPCGHFRNEQMTDDPRKTERSDDWCYSGCHEMNSGATSD